MAMTDMENIVMRLVARSYVAKEILPVALQRFKEENRVDTLKKEQQKIETQDKEGQTYGIFQKEEQLDGIKTKEENMFDAHTKEDQRAETQQKINLKSQIVLKFTSDMFRERKEERDALLRQFEMEYGCVRMHTSGDDNECTFSDSRRHIGDSQDYTVSMIYSNKMSDSVTEHGDTYVSLDGCKNKMTISDRLSNFFSLTRKVKPRRKIVNKRIEITQKTVSKKDMKSIDKKSKLTQLMDAFRCCVRTQNNNDN